MDMARVLPAEAGPTPSAADLEAYDAILSNASKLTFRMVQHVHQGKVTTFRVDADGTKDAFSIRSPFSSTTTARGPGKTWPTTSRSAPSSRTSY